MMPMTRTPEADELVDGAGSTGRVQSVDRALRLLDGVAAAAPLGETAAALAAQCDINRATAWRLLGTLEAHGLVERDPTSNRYTIGLALVRMSAAAGYDGLVRKTRHVLERVSSQTGETADIAVAGNAVADVTHILAELLENATTFSPPGSPVVVAGMLVNRQ